MSSFVPCNRESLLKVVREGVHESNRSPLEEHLGSCAACRLELERLSGGDDWLSEVRKHLSSSEIRAYKSGNLESTGNAGSWDRDPSRQNPSEELDAGDKLDFLDPSEDPTKLGRLGAYEIDSVIGRGGMGIVLKAFDAALNRHVAIKVLAAQLATSGSARKRFSREAQAAAAVVHEHVVAIYAVDNSSRLPFIVMPYIPGRSLQDRLDANGPLETKEILRIGIQTASGLAAAHAQGLVHRDIKPANILLENGIERVRITDFGLARAVDDASQTQSGFIAGTPQYMAPEQARGEPVDHRADLFSLGSVMYTMCSGHPPFRAETTLAVLRRICEETPRPLRETNPDIPDWLQAVISKLHARDSANRFQSAAEVATLLEQYLAHLQQPLVNPLPQFHLTKTRTSMISQVNWRRAAWWSIPVSSVALLLFLLAKVRFDQNRLPVRGYPLVMTNTAQPAMTTTASGMAGPSEPPARSRDLWLAWENALTETDRDLRQLEAELKSQTESIRTSEQGAVEDLWLRLDTLEQELKRN
ncbi:MAG: serine/threonine protein kinase [Planctomycetaceae bacterium]|nr:serine/threonine protein kinase [Planctomycetaceae bacterium]